MKLDRRCVHAADLGRVYLQPALQLAEGLSRGTYSVQPWLRAPLISRLFEVIAWLGIGTACDYYRRQDADSILFAHSSSLQAIITFYADANMSAFSPSLVWSVYDTIKQISVDKTWSRFGASGHPSVFGAGLLMSNRLASDTLADMGGLVITFGDDDIWNRATYEDPTAEEIETAGIDQYDASNPFGATNLKLTPAVLCAGFLRLLEHMARSESFFEAALESSPTSVLRPIGMVQAWRLDLTRPAVRGRFDALIETVCRTMSKEQGPKSVGIGIRIPFSDRKTDAAAQDFNDGFRAIAQRLMRSWNRDHQLWLEATA